MRLPAALAALALPLSGCWLISTAVDDALGSAASTAGNRVGQRVGENVANSMVGPGGSSAGLGTNARFTAMYTNMIFNYAFSNGGMVVSDVPYKVGDFTRFSVKNKDGKTGTIERAHLADDADGNQWWKVKYTDDEQKETTTLEALIDKDLKKLLRLRAKFPKDTEGKELAVTDENYFVPPTHLTAQSVQGATKGTESVTTTAGSFTAKHVVFGNGNGSVEWWIVDHIPGGTVKETGKNNGDDSDGFVMQLEAYGSGAKSELGSI